MNRKLAFLCGAWMMVATAAWGQSPESSKPVGPSLDVALTFNVSHDNDVPADTFWMQGGGAQVHSQFWKGLGAVADIGGLHTANIHSSGVGLDLVTLTVGPRYTWGPAQHRYTMFGQALAGEAFGSNSAFPSAAGVNSSANGLALVVGGGMNVPISHRFVVRAFEADWVRTQLPNATTDVQNNLRLGTGVTFRFR